MDNNVCYWDKFRIFIIWKLKFHNFNNDSRGDSAEEASVEQRHRCRHWLPPTLRSRGCEGSGHGGGVEEGQVGHGSIAATCHICWIFSLENCKKNWGFLYIHSYKYFFSVNHLQLLHSFHILPCNIDRLMWLLFCFWHNSKLFIIFERHVILFEAYIYRNF
jgi:hypothetical protein